jgi:hypothetical protein
LRRNPHDATFRRPSKRPQLIAGAKPFIARSTDIGYIRDVAHRRP